MARSHSNIIPFDDLLFEKIQSYAKENKMKTIKEATTDVLHKFFNIKPDQTESKIHQPQISTSKINDKPQKIILESKSDIDKIIESTLPHLHDTYKKILYAKLHSEKSINVMIEGKRLKII